MSMNVWDRGQFTRGQFTRPVNSPAVDSPGSQFTWAVNSPACVVILLGTAQDGCRGVSHFGSRYKMESSNRSAQPSRLVEAGCSCGTPSIAVGWWLVAGSAGLAQRPAGCFVGQLTCGQPTRPVNSPGRPIHPEVNPARRRGCKDRRQGHLLIGRAHYGVPPAIYRNSCGVLVSSCPC